MTIAKRITNLTFLRQQRITERIWLRYASPKFALRANFRYARNVIWNFDGIMEKIKWFKT